MSNTLSSTLPSLPVTEVLPDIAHALSQHDRLLLKAPTGAGKTTLVPLYLLDAAWRGDGKILMLEPRRLATRAAASRMAQLLNEPIGKTVGYRMQLDSKTSGETRIEVITEGILTRMLQHDPALSGVSLVIFDEFHERSLQADLGLALALQSQQGYREPDDPLKLLVMSATLDTPGLAELLDCPVIHSEGRSYPVTVHYSERPLPPGDIRAACDCMVDTIRQVIHEEEGHLLAFLPGTAEIRRVADRLQDYGLPAHVDVYPLHGSLSQSEQDQAIQPSPAGRRKIVLTSAIAETSLTIEGIRLVVDAGLMRIPRFDPRTGMTQLDTIRVSKASADQRKGRAGRLTSGKCYRLWTEQEHQQLLPFSPPEITDADLAPVVLELLNWGMSDCDEPNWVTAPPKAAVEQGYQLLETLGAIEHKHHRLSITPHGRAMVETGLHPRLAHMVLIARQQGQDYLAAQLCVLLTEKDPVRGYASERPLDIRLRLALLDGEPVSGLSVDQPAVKQMRRLTARWARRLQAKRPAAYRTETIATLLACAYPDRIARRRAQSGQFLLSAGQGAAVPDHDPLSASDYLVIPALGGQRKQSNATAFLACALQPEQISALYPDRLETHDNIGWDKSTKSVIANREIRFGALVLERQPLASPPAEAMSTALIEGIRQTGLQALPWTRESEQIRQRICCVAQFEPSWPDVTEAALLQSLEDWLAPFLTGMTKLDHLKKIDLIACLKALLDWSSQQHLEQEAPDRFKVPSGSQIRIDYSNPADPRLSVKLQELFGLLETPVICSGKLPVTIELLSPAMRPVQTTRDLKNFWHTTYHEVKKDLKGRYPKHYWPDDPFTAVATHRVHPDKQR
ncbi:ATP-dependent helicase HrpB [Kistimonas asteriae]|uniref:ATP-dependent helicase HrpB n=1 Tax=Kistimonas asteriae TaxID=517724 RepID=UPI001BABA33A|nr:ATP-dependent helicase HrpB [Kistimonas asteriae]